ncbi:hypothetical protein [Rhizobium sophoriradicis]|uniref:hypothetical protein n=1 Tax=Rhizobium sophoriradicis TaxID=1535245 RepID=UPI001FE1E417|nr:hypothetical protein [Rhizobium sophoriradicis]
MAEQKTITDVIGRQVKVDLPAKRVVLGFYFEDYMAVGGEKAYDSVVGISREAWEGWVPANWKMHLAHRPSLGDIADVGEVEAQTFSIEKVLSLNPDLVILAAGSIRRSARTPIAWKSKAFRSSSSITTLRPSSAMSPRPCCSGS